MLGKLFELTAGAVKETYNGVAAVVEYTYDEVTSIPSSLEKGWDEGLLKSDTEPAGDTTPTIKPDAKVETPEDTPKSKFG